MGRALACVALATMLAGTDAHGAVDVAEVDRLAREVMESRGLPGLAIGVMSGGEVVLARGYGVASLKSKEPVTPRTQFAVGSITKQLTCALALTLADQGLLSMNDPVERHVQGLTRGGDIRLIDLARHVSGYRDYWPLDIETAAMREKRGIDVALALARRPLEFEPRTRHAYSNTNYVLLGAAIEAAGKARYADLMGERIFRPLGMSDSSVGPTEGKRATGYESWAAGAWEPAKREPPGWAGAAGEIWSTPSDLLRWSRALMEGSLLSETSRSLMVTDTRLPDGLAPGYGCGIRIGQRRGRLVLNHVGLVPGFWGSLTIMPATRSALVILANGENLESATAPIARAVLGMLAPPEPQPLAVSGRPVLEAATALMSQLRAGAIERSALGRDFGAWLTRERLASLSASLRALGEAAAPEVVFVEERGGMEHSMVRFRFPSMSLVAEMYRAPDGTIEQFTPTRE